MKSITVKAKGVTVWINLAFPILQMTIYERTKRVDRVVSLEIIRKDAEGVLIDFKEEEFDKAEETMKTIIEKIQPVKMEDFKTRESSIQPPGVLNEVRALDQRIQAQKNKSAFTKKGSPDAEGN